MRIRNSLTYKFVLIVASMLLLFSCAIYYFSASYREQEFDKRLADKGLTTARLLIKVDEVDMKLLRIIDKNNLTALQNEKITIYDSQFKKLYSSDDEPEIPIAKDLVNTLNKEGSVFFNDGPKEVVGLISNENNQKFYVIVSAYDRFGINKLNNLRIILTIGFLISILIVFGVGWFFSGQALKPISEIINNVRKISGQNLNSRINEGNGRDEIAQLAIQFNHMLERIEQSFEIQRTFVSNASHELRTPLTIIRTQLEVSLNAERDNDYYKSKIESVLEDIKGLIKLSNGLLDLAQTSFDIENIVLKKVRVDELLYQCVSEISKKYPSQKINFNIDENLEDEQVFVTKANEPLLKTSFLNILDNACKYSSNSVSANIGFLGKEIIISIIDSGVGISQADMEHIYDPFFRGSNARKVSSGHGIGLPLSNKIIQIHKGKIELISRINEGTSVIVHLPSLAD